VPTPRQFVSILSLVLLAVVACGSAATAITVTIDYSKDTSGFFGTSNPQGPTGAAQARTSLEAAATFYSDILEDTFSTFEIPETFYGSLGGEARWFWKQRITNPTTGLNEATLNASAPAANDFVVFVGARDLPDAGLGLAGPGGFVGGFASESGAFTTAERTQLDATEAAFLNGTKRGQSTGFSSWGGSAAFDNGTNWHFNHTSTLPAGAVDFYSVALHELGHALGLGTSADWNKLVVGTGFTGANTLTHYTPVGNVPLASADDKGHWLKTIEESPIYEGIGTQVPIMVPGLDPGQVLRQLTNLDAAALADIGWQIDLPGGAASAATFVSSGSQSSQSSQSAVLFTLSSAAVPEPATVLLVSIAASGLLFVKPRRRRAV
jgi:hypothetical protein